jgi:putative transposase
MTTPSYLYPDDLSDEEWELLAPLVPPAKRGGRPRKWLMRTFLDGIFYLLQGGCARRYLSHEYPPWPTV